MAQKKLLARAEKDEACVVVIGMAGSGKSTIGRALAKRLDYAFVDTDILMESAYGAPLQEVTDALTREEFLDLEARFVSSLRLGRCVVATGGSVVYREAAMEHLKKLGPIVSLMAPLEVIEARIALKPDRGLAIGEGQTVADLFNEREPLYKKYGDLSCDTDRDLQACIDELAGGLEPLLQARGAK